jgi:hypothetical protein
MSATNQISHTRGDNRRDFNERKKVASILGQRGDHKMQSLVVTRCLSMHSASNSLQQF